MKYKHLLACPNLGAAELPAWWPRDDAGAARWIYVDNDMLSWSVLPGQDSRIPEDEVDLAQETFEDENDPWEFDFRVEDA